jgi:hypothetical protein
MDEIDALKTELAHYRHEKEKIRDVIGQIGGKSTKKQDRTINVIFLAVVVGFFLFDVVRHILQLDLPYLPPSLLLEAAVLLVSVKIIWMIHRQAKVDHFQFWILNSIEFQMNMISRRLTSLEAALQSPGRDAAAEPADPPEGRQNKSP